MTLDFIVWAKAYADENPEAKSNMENWEPISQSVNSIVPEAESVEVEGVIASINGGGHAFVKTDHLEETGRKNICIGSRLIKNNELSRGIRVRVTTSGKLLDNGALAAESYICL